MDINCSDCSAERRNVRYKNTRYCSSCRLLRDLTYVGDEQRPCAGCTQPFAPVSRKDTRCGTCTYGSLDEGFCWFCDSSDAELYRPGIPLCCSCVRSIAKRGTVLGALKKGQRDRRQANNHAAVQS